MPVIFLKIAITEEWNPAILELHASWIGKENSTDTNGKDVYTLVELPSPDLLAYLTMCVNARFIKSFEISSE